MINERNLQVWHGAQKGNRLARERGGGVTGARQRR